MVERNGVVIGAAELTAEPAFPGTVSGLVSVTEAERGRGIGTELAGVLLEHLEQTDAESATCAIRDDLASGREFAERFGFVVTTTARAGGHDLSNHLSELLDRTAYAVGLAQVQIRLAEPVAEKTAVTEFIRACMAGLSVPSGNVHGFHPGERLERSDGAPVAQAGNEEDRRLLELGASAGSEMTATGVARGSYRQVGGELVDATVAGARHARIELLSRRSRGAITWRFRANRHTCSSRCVRASTGCG